jgi:hypothetical protein
MSNRRRYGLRLFPGFEFPFGGPANTIAVPAGLSHIASAIVSHPGAGRAPPQNRLRGPLRTPDLENGPPQLAQIG